MQSNPYQSVMMGGQARFVATVSTQKIICSVTNGCIMPDGFNMSDQSRFQPLLKGVVDATLVEKYIVLINKIVQAADRIIRVFDSE